MLFRSRAKRLDGGVPVVAVCGARADDLDAVYESGIDAVLPIERGPQGVEEALSPACTRSNLIAIGETVARLMRVL